MAVKGVPSGSAMTCCAPRESHASNSHLMGIRSRERGVAMGKPVEENGVKTLQQRDCSYSVPRAYGLS